MLTVNKPATRAKSNHIFHGFNNTRDGIVSTPREPNETPPVMPFVIMKNNKINKHKNFGFIQHK